MPRITGFAGPVGHAVNPEHQPAGGQAAQVVGALQQHDIGTGTRGGDSGGGAGRATTDHQHVAVAEHPHVARRFRDRAQVSARSAR
jgi:hypothetical protein